MDPTATKEIVVKKIDSLRSNFRKEFKKIKDSKRSGSGTDNLYTTKLWYFDKLQFLVDQETHRNGVSNISEIEPNEDSAETTVSKLYIFRKFINVFFSTLLITYPWLIPFSDF